MRRSAILAVAGLLLFPWAQGVPAQNAPVASSKRAQAVRLTGRVALDGKLDEAIWQSAPALTDFVQKEPVQGGAPGDDTEVRFAYDDEALYVGLRMYSKDPERIPRAVTRRDQYGNSEHIVVTLDAYLDRRTAASFAITSGGVRRDYLHTRDSEGFEARDFTYDPVWEARVQVDMLGWSAEMRIPFSQLRFTDKPTQVWGLNINRYVPQRNEDIYWVMVPRTETGYVSRFGTLEGLDGIQPRRRIEVVPYVAGNADYVEEPSALNPFRDGSTAGMRAGADLKVGLGPSLTLDATFNPDFGQVEADPAEVNLTAFETFFPERRPYFTDGNRSLMGPVVNYYYSRRIGAPPRGQASADFVDAPANTTILGAGRVTGRLGPRLTVGAQVAVTQREFARTYDLRSDTFGRQEVEPFATYGVLRLQQQVGESQSVVGFSLSGMRRDFTEGSPLQNSLSRGAAAGGADWVIRFQGGRYELSGNAGFTYVGGDSVAILRLQRSSARYYQRPDYDAAILDPSRTALWGYTAQLRADKNAGNWLWGFDLRTESPGFEANDMGRLSTSDDFDFEGDINYRQTEPGKVFRWWNVGVYSRINWTYDLVRGDSRVAVFGRGQLSNFWNVELNFGLRPRGLDHSLTRGGPLMGQLSGGSIGFNVRSNYAKPTSWSVGGEIARGEDGLRALTIAGGLELRPSAAAAISLGPNVVRYIDPQQYYTTLANGPAATFGNRYVFARVTQSVLSLQTRVNYTLNPDLTVELYAEPFAASGRFRDLGELPAPRRFDLRRYGTDGTTITAPSTSQYRIADSRNGDTFTLPNADFSTFSFRSNFVIRWEWARGSTLYLVWQQNRAAQCTTFQDPAECPVSVLPGANVRPGFLGSTLTIPGDNYLAVKISYWLSL